MILPEIDYKFWLSNWKESIGQLQVFSNVNIAKYISFDGDINACTNEIFDIVSSGKTDKESILRVIDLIYSWGGKSGRFFYASTKGLPVPRDEIANNNTVFSMYLQGVVLAQSGNPATINHFCKINGIGPSYASKHAHFWSLKSASPLIIVDSKIAGSLAYSKIEQLRARYSDKDIIAKFNEKARIEFDENDPSKIEKALFAFHNHYFKNDNSGWKNNTPGQDYAAAQKLAATLFNS
ncbi:hypothetical protein ACRN93_21955 [Shewanella baltica]|uniref:hypothetical protein n=1 Tax=Shewanella baltica TaxID=62322 RepID=UPI003D7AA7CC